jgi:hypothetical protein
VLPIADALCRFNPVYGLGMASAAEQARLLQTVFGRRTGHLNPLLAIGHILKARKEFS